MAEYRGDQASGLRRLFSPEALRVITFAAGSEGVGKTATVANIAAAMARQGKEVLVLDENTTGNVSSVFGATAKHDLFHVINRDRRLSEVLVHVAPGVRVLPAARAVKKLGKLQRSQQEALLEALGSMEHPADVILVDASIDHPLGFSPLGLATQETVVVAAATGAAITEAYALIKKVSLGYSRRHFKILVNKVKAADDAEAIHANLAQLARQRGVARLDYVGHVPLDDALRHAAKLCQPVVAAYPESAAANALRAIAADMLHWPPAEAESGGLEQFVQQLIHLSQRIDPVTIHAG
ncbi:MAG: flagellar biosynthesis protein FlhG [Pseudomonadota bacterium]|nr:flagellar biosynthesis protein FlhG [Pseudomonadota bacterium]